MTTHISSLFSYIYSRVQPTGVLLNGNNKIISIQDTALDIYFIKIHAVSDEEDL